jgi:1,3,6,8-tetrahydroxynaphthalene synthase
VATVGRPVVTLPDHTLDQQEFLDHIATRFRHHPNLRAVLRILRNTTVRTRHFALPWAELTTSASLGRRNRLYQREGVALAARAARAALTEADLRPDQVGSLIVVSCTGHALPGIDAHLVGALGLPPTVRRLPVMQMGCAGGAYALARAADLTRAYPGTHSLVIAIELPSLSYQGDDTTISTLVSQALFGDACAAAVICPDDDRTGLRLGPSWEYLLLDSLDDMVYWLNEHGFHFDTLPSVTRCIQRTCPGLKDWLHTPTATTPSGDPQFLIAHRRPKDHGRAPRRAQLRRTTPGPLPGQPTRPRQHGQRRRPRRARPHLPCTTAPRCPRPAGRIWSRRHHGRPTLLVEPPGSRQSRRLTVVSCGDGG